jgi:predicted amidohydrolase YtcJ
MYVASNTTANNFELHRSAAKNVINLTSKYVIPGLFDMHMLQMYSKTHTTKVSLNICYVHF